MKRSLRVPLAHAKRSSAGERLAERRLRDPHLAVDRVRDAELAEHGVEHAAHAVDAGHDDADLLRRRARADEREQLLADELERPAAAGALEEVDRAVERRRLAGLVLEERALEMRERRRGDRAVARRQLLDRAAPRGAARSSAVRWSERNAARPGSYGSETVTSVRAASASMQRPLRAGQILEAVREDRRAGPRVEVGAEPVDGGAPAHAAVRAAERLQLGAVRRPERAELAADRVRLEQPRLELVERLQERLGEASPRRRLAEAAELGARKHAPHEERALRAPERPSADAAAIRSNSPSNVTIEPPSSAPARARSSPSTRSTSARFGTTRTGSWPASSAARYRSRRSSTLPALAGPAIKRSGTRLR